MFKITPDIFEAVAFIRLELYNLGLPCGSKFILKRMKEYGIPPPLPSLSSINNILKLKSLTHKRTGFYSGDTLHHTENIKIPI